MTLLFFERDTGTKILAEVTRMSSRDKDHRWKTDTYNNKKKA